MWKVSLPLCTVFLETVLLNVYFKFISSCARAFKTEVSPPKVGLVEHVEVADGGMGHTKECKSKLQFKLHWVFLRSFRIGEEKILAIFKQIQFLLVSNEAEQELIKIMSEPSY